MARFLVHCHTAGRRHFDLRLIQDDRVRSWSMLKEPPEQKGERRLAIEREALSVDEIGRPRIEEEAFGAGRVRVWDGGEVTVLAATPERLTLIFAGARLAGRYELRRTRWYPGNRWLFEKSGPSDTNLT
jgi:bifunctional non-homologous end joining protein LigD